MLPATCASDLLPIPFHEPPELSADVSVGISSSYASAGVSALPRTGYFIPVPCVSHCCGGPPQSRWVGCWLCIVPGCDLGRTLCKESVRRQFWQTDLCAVCLFGGELRCPCWGVLGSICVKRCTLHGIVSAPSVGAAGGSYACLEEKKMPFYWF